MSLQDFIRVGGFGCFGDAEFGGREIVNIVLNSVFGVDSDHIGAVSEFALVACCPGIPVGGPVSPFDFSDTAEFCSL